MKTFRWFLPAIFGLLYWASFHPLNLGFLAWIAVVPLLLYAKTNKGAISFFVAWFWAAVSYTACFSWVHYTVPYYGPLFLGFYKGLYIPIFVLIVRRIGAAWAPAVWVSLEYLRSHLFSGLAWFLIGSSQHEMLWLIQISDIGGVWLVSALVVFVNAALVQERRAYRWAAVAAMLVSVVYGGIRANTIEMREGPRVAVVQPNIPQDVKLISLTSRDQALENFRKHVRLTLAAAEEEPDLIVWPEAALYDGLRWNVKTSEWEDDLWYRRVLEPSQETGAPILIGLLVKEGHAGGASVTYTNSAVLIRPDEGVVERFDKVHLVPFSEYTLMGTTFPWIRDVVYKISGLRLADMRPGEGFPIWELKGERYGTQICFEAIFPEISREIARNGGGFTVNISNDGWFGDSAELDQMLAMSRFRAVENRIGVVRATNTGISAFFEPTGRIHEIIPGKEVEGVAVARVRIAESGSLFRSLGDWVPWAAVLAVLGAIIRRIFVDTRKKRA